ncbi:hypothetical protein ACOJBO_40570 [Rhizobium beringeri]
MGEIGRQKRTGPFLTGALLASFSASIVVGLIYLAIAACTSTQLGSIVGSSATDLFFVAGCALTAVTLVLDQALVGLLRSSFQLARNVVFAASKLLLLIALGLTLGRASSGLAIFTTWFAGQLVSLVVVAGLLVYAGRRVFHRPEIHAFRPVLGQVFGHHALQHGCSGAGSAAARRRHGDAVRPDQRRLLCRLDGAERCASSPCVTRLGIVCHRCAGSRSYFPRACACRSACRCWSARRPPWRSSSCRASCSGYSIRPML